MSKNQCLSLRFLTTGVCHRDFLVTASSFGRNRSGRWPFLAPPPRGPSPADWARQSAGALPRNTRQQPVCVTGIFLCHRDFLVTGIFLSPR
ncbi:MAG: hypothetical protein KDB23_05710, partial [Planctomycetales bacterium]|nr:hypothetical protein [Planctomycetales bacterium]